MSNSYELNLRTQFAPPANVIPKGGERGSHKPELTVRKPLRFSNKWLKGEAPKGTKTPEEVQRLIDECKNSVQEETVPYQCSAL